MKKYFVLAGLFTSLTLGFVISHKNTRLPNAFTPQKMAQNKWDEFPNTDCPIELLNQPFKYIAHGTQMIAFEGEDKKTILKFFLENKIEGKKQYFLRSISNLIPSLRKKKEIKKQAIKEKNLRFAFACYAKAIKDLKEESGLIGIHLSPTKNLYPTCTVEDFDGKKWQIDLDQASFILQEKVRTVGEIFPTLQTREEKQKFIQAMEDLLESRTRKGFQEMGQGKMFSDNYGFIGNRAYVIDVGRLAYSEEILQNPEPEITRMKTRLHNRFSP